MSLFKIKIFIMIIAPRFWDWWCFWWIERILECTICDSLICSHSRINCKIPILIRWYTQTFLKWILSFQCIITCCCWIVILWVSACTRKTWIWSISRIRVECRGNIRISFTTKYDICIRQLSLEFSSHWCRWCWCCCWWCGFIWLFQYFFFVNTLLSTIAAWNRCCCWFIWIIEATWDDWWCDWRWWRFWSCIDNFRCRQYCCIVTAWKWWCIDSSDGRFTINNCWLILIKWIYSLLKHCWWWRSIWLKLNWLWFYWCWCNKWAAIKRRNTRTGWCCTACSGNWTDNAIT